MALTSTEEARLRALIAQQAALLSLAGNEATITSKLSATKVNLSGIAAASSLVDTDITLVRQGAADKSSSLTVLKTWITSSMSAISTASGFASSLSGSGYIKFPSWLGGWIVQWGASSAIPAGSSVSVTYPITFPTQQIRTFATMQQTVNASTPVGVGVGASPTTSGTVIYNISASSVIVVNYIAIGN